MTPLLLNTALGIVSIFFSAVLGINYNSPILNHLTDLIQGANTKTIVSLNAPNWGLGQPLATPAISTIATSSNATAASGLASSTPYYFQVAALDGDGTTTVSTSATITTDASTTQPLPEVINLSWSPIAGAQGYAIFFSTSTATNFTQYFLATSTNGIANTLFSFSTSTGSLPGSYTKSDTTAYSNRILPGFSSFFNGGVFGFGTSTPASSTPIDINGYVRATAQATSTTCYAATAGVVFFNAANKHEWGCNGTSWSLIF